jgi:hypothetical protein
MMSPLHLLREYQDHRCPILTVERLINLMILWREDRKVFGFADIVEAILNEDVVFSFVHGCEDFAVAFACKGTCSRRD